MSDEYEREYERIKKIDWVKRFEERRHLPPSEEMMLELYSPRDWDHLIVRIVKGRPDVVEAWDRDRKRWGEVETNYVKVLRAPLATHAEMDLQGVPADDRTRLNPKG